MPPANDDLANATVVTSASTLSIDTVGSTAEAQETSEGYPDTGVWVRVEVPSDGTMPVAVTDATFAYRVDIYKPADSTPTSFSDVTDGFTYDSLLYFLTGGALGDDADEDVTVLAGEVWYLHIYDYDFSGVEGTLSLAIAPPFTCFYDAAPGANLGSGTVSIVDTDWVREEQIRDWVADVSLKGDWEYEETFSITVDCPAGKYEGALFNRYEGEDASRNDVVLRVYKNGKTIGGYWHSAGRTDGDEDWEIISNESLDPAYTDLNQFGGPRYFDVAPGDVLTFCIGSDDWEALGGSSRVMEVQQVRLRAVIGALPLPQWRIQGNLETQGPWSFNCIDMVKSFGNKVYAFLDTPELGIYIWELVNGDTFQAVTGDVPLGGADMAFSRVYSPSSVATQIWGHDFVVFAEDDIYAAWTENYGNSLQQNYRLVLAHWDGASWTNLNTDVGANSGKFMTSVSVDGDPATGDVYIAWGEARQSTSPRGFWWRCKKWDGSLTELGSGQTAYPGGSVTETNDGEFDRGVRLKVSPAGVPWVAWCAYDDDAADAGNYEEHAFAWYWDGSAWQDSGVPDPSMLPGGHGIASHSYVLANGDSGNYLRFAAYGFYQVDLTFCHHDGPSENPSIMFQYVFDDKISPGTAWDNSLFVYMEYDGSSWGNEVYIEEGAAAGGGNLHGTIPNEFAQATDTGNGLISTAHGWTQGFSLDNDGSTVYMFSQKGWRFSNVDRVYSAKLLPDGSAFTELGQGFPDSEASPDWDFGGWTDVTTNAGCLVNGLPVLMFRWNGSTPFGVVLAAFLPMGGVVSMNWRSADRMGQSRRVLVGR
jgi:hypothetical protein